MNGRMTLLIVCLLVPATCSASYADDAVTDSFLQMVEASDSYSDQQKLDAQTAFKEWIAESPADAITESLIVLHPEYADAIEATDEEDVARMNELLAPFVESENQFLAADATYYHARTLMNLQQYERALPLLSRVTGELSEYSVHVGDAMFYTGAAQAGLLQYEQAIASLTEFLQFHPDAAERLRVAAWRQVQQLQAIEDGKMADIYQRMDFSRRRLSLIEPGEETQQQQQKIVNMLAKLIKEEEKKEASSENSDQQKNSPQQQQQQQAQKNQQQGKSETGGKSSNPNGKLVRKAYDDGPSSPWSRLRDRSRDPANNAIKDKLPARYRDIVERYYEAANGDSNR